jgi:hypothetical protein
MFLEIVFITFLYFFIDYFLNAIFSWIFNKPDLSLQGNYYFVHAINNLLIVYFSYNDVINLYSNIYSLYSPSNAFPSILTYSLHFYHMIYYYQKLRFDDWLHHLLMVGVSLPLANYFGNTIALNHSLFYLTGLPGLIDYTLLFLERNHVISKMTEKSVNRILNLFVRNTGCVIHSFITLSTLLMPSVISTMSLADILIAIITSILVFWNGTYFMEQVIVDYHMRNNAL